MAASEDRSHLCPLCGEPNACVMAATGDMSLPCWCRDVKVPARLLARLPVEERNARCVCSACIDKFRRAKTVPDPSGGRM